MEVLGQLLLRDRPFQVKRAALGRTGEFWWIEVETEREEYGGEWWAPTIRHEGLRVNASTAGELEGKRVAWGQSRGVGYDHPEIGTMYVFGHHEIEDAVLNFGGYSKGQIALSWKGVADVLWDESFAERVDFACECKAQVHEG